MASNFIKRAITGVLFVAILVGCILYTSFSFGILFIIISALTIYEFGQLVNMRADGVNVNKTIIMLGGKFLNIIFRQNLPRSEKHRISLVENKIATEPGEPETPETLSIGEDGYVHLELRYNTYDDVTDYWGWGRVSYNLEKFYPTPKEGETTMKGFKVTINSEENGEGVVVVLDLEHPVGVPEKAKDVHATSVIR